jgi:cell division protein ZapE
MTPLQHYQAALQQSGFVEEPLQRAAVERTQSLYDALLACNGRSRPWLARLWQKPPPVPRGLYFMGSTGRGKTWLVDSFYQCLPFPQKHRVHFHRFMLDIHQRLRTLPRSPDPLQVIGRELAAQYRVLCLDEFHVHDIGDAMIMAGLLQAMFERDLVLVATSNIAIRDLYRNGLQRERFLPAIALLETWLEEVDLQAGQDYRLLRLEQSDNFQVGEAADLAAALAQRFAALAPTPPQYRATLMVNGRELPCAALADDVVWFDFQVLCNTPRAASDYIELACQFHSLFLSHIPVLGEAQDDVAKRFIHLVDALYDHGVKLVATADAPPDRLYTGRRLKFAFERTTSRLFEMGSRDYLARPHNAMAGFVSQATPA